jgi:hypothetical protein
MAVIARMSRARTGSPASTAPITSATTGGSGRAALMELAIVVLILVEIALALLRY